MKKKYIDEDLPHEELKSIKVDLTEFIKNLEEEKIKKIVEISGSQDKKGSLIVLDAYPEKLPKLETDIMNVHYPEYYSGEKLPADNQQPNPINFITISKG
ncbi:MAG: type III-B CRISPR module RAMP protein Cmr6 [Persephonella sp.]|nr:type III-B CRISPR module RAMP protein Cmr6 [Persephonella sp.]